MKNKFLKSIFILTFLSCAALMCGVAYFDFALPDSYSITKGNTLSFNERLPVSFESGDKTVAQTDAQSVSGEKIKGNIKLFGIVPVKSADLKLVDSQYVNVIGAPFGIKLYTKGVLVVDITPVDTAGGNTNVAKNAGLKIGDEILRVDGVQVDSNADIAYIIENSGGKTLDLQVVRNNQSTVIKLKPEFSQSGNCYKGGIWVRDSSAGIGTLTFYSPANKTVCGLGHGLCDCDAGCIMPADSGELVSAEIISYTKSKNGSPGELKGRLTGKTLAKLNFNGETGVYGNALGYTVCDNYMPVATKNEVKTGDAQILTTIDGTGTKGYNCKIISIDNKKKTTKNLVVKITDEELLKKTGGILQGMSGSPVLQNGRLIGAITHVLVDDPTTGYAIFAENMLETAQGVANENKLKEAS